MGVLLNMVKRANTASAMLGIPERRVMQQMYRAPMHAAPPTISAMPAPRRIPHAEEVARQGGSVLSAMPEGPVYTTPRTPAWKEFLGLGPSNLSRDVGRPVANTMSPLSVIGSPSVGLPKTVSALGQAGTAAQKVPTSLPRMSPSLKSVQKHTAYRPAHLNTMKNVGRKLAISIIAFIS